MHNNDGDNDETVGMEEEKKKENRGEKKEERRNAYVPAGEREEGEKERKGPVYGLGSITTKNYNTYTSLCV